MDDAIFLIGTGFSLAAIILATRFKAKNARQGDLVSGWSVGIFLFVIICTLFNRCDVVFR